MATFGLPHYVLGLLQHMEEYKDCLKWNISEGSHKITLTLKWNFRKLQSTHGTVPGAESIWNKVQRTLRIKSPEISYIPSGVSQFLSSSPENRRRQQPWRRMVTANIRPFTWLRSSSLSLPTRGRPVHRASFARNSLRDTSHHSSPSASTSFTASPSRYSLPDTNVYCRLPFNRTRFPPSLDTLPRTSTPPLASTPDTTDSRMDSLTSGGTSVYIRYRGEEDMTESPETLVQKRKQRAQEELREIRAQWEESLQNWPASNPDDPAATNSARISGSSRNSSASETEESALLCVKETVQNCLENCDRILHRHSTLIE